MQGASFPSFMWAVRPVASLLAGHSLFMDAHPLRADLYVYQQSNAGHSITNQLNKSVHCAEADSLVMVARGLPAEE
jgi:hypothetical protein